MALEVAVVHLFLVLLGVCVVVSLLSLSIPPISVFLTV